MRSKEVSKIVLQMSEGVFSSLVDLVLWNIFFIEKLSPFAQSSGVRKAEALANKELQRFNYLAIKRAIKKTQEKGWIKEDFTLTKEGKERLGNILPNYFGKRRWDGNWYLVIYDIPEKKKRLRDILRENLKLLGFGKLQESCWISPFNFFGEVEEITKDYKIFPYVILAITSKLGRKEAKSLAEKVWDLDKINRQYQKLLTEGEREKSDKKELYFRYLNILRKDPQLPEELLSLDWAGHRAFKFFKEFKSSTT